MFSKLSDDVVLTIFFKLQDDPCSWARLACVCTKFNSLICNICLKDKCTKAIPAVVSNLLSSSDDSVPGGWPALYKLSICCPGLYHAGVLVEYSYFGLERDLGSDDNYHKPASSQSGNPSPTSSSDGNSENRDDLDYDTVYDVAVSQNPAADQAEAVNSDKTVVKAGERFFVCKRRKISRALSSHLACGVWNLSREHGKKLLNSRYREDSLYISDWPGCIHVEEKRSYMLFRGIFKNFKQSKVWRAINEGNRSKHDIKCAFCDCKETWDLHYSFCLRRLFGFHEDGEPFVRAYVCDNGHVSGAWTESPVAMYGRRQ